MCRVCRDMNISFNTVSLINGQMLTALDQLSQLYTQYTTDVDTVLVYCLDLPVADPGIDKRGGGADYWKNLYTTQLAIICSSGVWVQAPPENFAT